MSRFRDMPLSWVPLAFVVLALVLLFGTPIVVSHRVSKVRDDLADVADQARIELDGFETAFATELVEQRARSAPPARADSIAAAAGQAERQHQHALDSLVARLGGEAVERFTQLRSAEQVWRAGHQVASANAPPNTQATGAGAGDANGRSVLAAAAGLDQYLFRESGNARIRVRRLERINVYSAAALAPIALIALAIVFMLQRRVSRFAHEADDRAAQLERSVELRATLIRGVTHDIKNPLGAAAGYADLLEDGLAGPINGQQLEMVKRIKRLVGTAEHTVRELVDLARVDAGEFPIAQSETNIGLVVREAVDDYSAAAMQKHLTLKADVPASPITVKTDPTRVRHVLDNLLSNAIKYTPPGGSVTVGAAASGAHDHGSPSVQVKVEDDGPGIPADYRDSIFDEFVRAPSQTGAPGSGLGLAISRRIARMLGGDVTLSNAPARGSVFTLTLPAERDGGA
jgi:signal transduction histidine kinase